MHADYNRRFLKQRPLGLLCATTPCLWFATEQQSASLRKTAAKHAADLCDAERAVAMNVTEAAYVFILKPCQKSKPPLTANPCLAIRGHTANGYLRTDTARHSCCDDEGFWENLDGVELATQ
ncbi:hypothetical protein COEREDRAFT_12716 [Coemansia reversa NRRL 1564]|uniref:Uncharacterized protein n=1 Tax=Coemansia reversa (strain ATCC 12441 / NRRL 1564) TaxID=763665 RepID=A0A2G5B0E2_COERN|nr:hypothetical protein COEREDRAFT_12716 [Coemansia reversa NRRL 1564]|eukprot:PIA12495.1 hypothetical protein COEREDRAFT_12716 [Coemansia reversa NRRL 1564]